MVIVMVITLLYLLGYNMGDKFSKALQICKSAFCNSAIKWGFLLENNRNCFLESLKREKSCFIAEQIWYY